jgi:phage shock protein A
MITHVTYEEPEARHERIQSDITNHERKNQNRERYSDPIILSGSDKEKIDQLLYAIRTYEDDIAAYRRRIQQLEEKLESLAQTI